MRCAGADSTANLQPRLCPYCQQPDHGSAGCTTVNDTQLIPLEESTTGVQGCFVRRNGVYYIARGVQP